MPSIELMMQMWAI